MFLKSNDSLFHSGTEIKNSVTMFPLLYIRSTNITHTLSLDVVLRIGDAYRMTTIFKEKIRENNSFLVELPTSLSKFFTFLG